jgi:hypothetical protein
MSAPAKRTLLVVIAAILVSAVSSAFAVTLARLTRRQLAESNDDSADQTRA